MGAENFEISLRVGLHVPERTELGYASLYLYEARGMATIPPFHHI